MTMEAFLLLGNVKHLSDIELYCSPLLFDKQTASILGPWTEVQEQSFIIILYRQMIVSAVLYGQQ